MTVYSFDKEFAVETEKSVEFGGKVQKINFTDNYIKKINKTQLAIENLANDLEDVDDSKMSAKEKDKLVDQTYDKLRDIAINALNKLLGGRGQELYSYYHQNTNALLSMIAYLDTLANDVIKDKKNANKSK